MMKKFTSIKDERLFIPLKAEKSHCYQTYTTRNKKENASGRRSMIPDGNLDSHKETKMLEMVKIKEIIHTSVANNLQFTYNQDTL